jgi:putative NADH-flavin reductase
MRHKILVLGATGATGREVVSQALGRGDEVTVLVRDPKRLGVEAGRVRVVVGSVPEDAAALAEALRGEDAVVSALGVGKSLRSNGLMSRSLPALVAAMQAAGVKRLIVMSAAGVGDTFNDHSTLGRILASTLLREIFADKKAGEEAVRASSLDWTIAYPTLLTDGPRTGNWRAAERMKLHGVPSISRADVADFLLAQLDERTYSRRGAIVTS